MNKILYIGDNPQYMRIVRKILGHAGYAVVEAETGLDGLAVAGAEHPDLIIVDVNLPDIDGLEVTARLKAKPESG